MGLHSFPRLVGPFVAGGRAVEAGIITPATRLACLERYRQKKARRTYGKHIRYHMRKVNADRRPRVKGRFIKAADPPLTLEGGGDGDANPQLVKLEKGVTA